jgi:deoxycytidine triphosphate deaminase
MSIKSDRWIRRMAQEHAMISPFEPNQVKQVNGQRIVSHGTSSYGYDIRCSDEFKNEGVAQVVFFESDPDDVCEPSYKDRGGKYQGQQGVTLPKI